MEERQTRRRFMRLSALGAAAAAVCSRSVRAEPRPSVADAVEQAHRKLWAERIDALGLIHDHVGELPTPEDCEQGRPNAIGWWSPMEDAPMFTGLYLPAVCERARRSRSERDRTCARRLAQGLLKCASVSDVPGFIARGVGSDGRCHYPCSSDDQTHPWFYGLDAYLRSGIPRGAERRQVVAKMAEVAGALEANAWRVPCDGAFKGQFRGAFTGALLRDAARYLFMLRVMYDATRDRVWLDRYRAAAAERPEGGALTRAGICAAGFGPDERAIPHLDETQLWIYVGSQASLARLAALEPDAALRAQYRAGAAANQARALQQIDACRQFDNADTKLYGDANWREVHGTWFPQHTQADAEKLSKIRDHAKGGERKQYEARYMRNPLAAAAIIALAGAPGAREAVEPAIRHYDYARLHMSEFFFAEVAYYALPRTAGPS